jgi:hypothetical protein
MAAARTAAWWGEHMSITDLFLNNSIKIPNFRRSVFQLDENSRCLGTAHVGVYCIKIFVFVISSNSVLREYNYYSSNYES